MIIQTCLLLMDTAQVQVKLLSHLRSPHFEHQAVFCDFLQSPLQDIVTEFLKISHDQFLSNPIQLNI